MLGFACVAIGLNFESSVEGIFLSLDAVISGYVILFSIGSLFRCF